MLLCVAFEVIMKKNNYISNFNNVIITLSLISIHHLIEMQEIAIFS